MAQLHPKDQAAFIARKKREREKLREPTAEEHHKYGRVLAMLKQAKDRLEEADSLARTIEHEHLRRKAQVAILEFEGVVS